MGAGVIDADYRGEIGVILFNFSNEDFVVNMGDRIAQIIFKKIKTPELKELVWERLTEGQVIMGALLWELI